LITEDKIRNYILNNPKLIEEWLYYTEDIRHTPAWGFVQDKNGFWLLTYLDKDKLLQKFVFKDKFTACAKMIKMTFELIRSHRDILHLSHRHFVNHRISCCVTSPTTNAKHKSQTTLQSGKVRFLRDVSCRRHDGTLMSQDEKAIH
jgi:hypothetical protein